MFANPESLLPTDFTLGLMNFQLVRCAVFGPNISFRNILTLNPLKHNDTSGHMILGDLLKASLGVCFFFYYYYCKLVNLFLVCKLFHSLLMHLF